MSAPLSQSIDTHFAALPDPRKLTKNTRHLFRDMLVIAICAVLCGANDWVAVAEFGQAQLTWLQGFLALPNGIPSHDTFTRVFARIDPEQFQQCFLAWVTHLAPLLPDDLVHIDGKTLRRSHDAPAGRAAIHMVSAWASRASLVLGQRKTEAKSNEITAIPQLLDVLELTGCLVTIDAMGCQKAIAEKIRARGADYLLALKENHPTLYQHVHEHFFPAEPVNWATCKLDFAHDIVPNRDRVEHRYCWIEHDLSWLPEVTEWADLHAVVCLESERHQKGEVSHDVRYYLASARMTGDAALNATRTHWSIENELHWVLDVAFREDECRLRKGHGAQNFAILRHLVLNLLNQDTTTRAGTHTKRLKAGWSEDYREQLLAGMTATET
jgi:predicted transposase YbfD/YdcC